MKFIKLTALSLIIFSSSCKKEDDIDPIPSTPENSVHYMPLKTGNTWNYNSSSFGNYTVTVGGQETMQGELYYKITTTTSTEPGFMKYIGNKQYTLHNQGGGVYTKLLMIDEDASIGDEWNAGTYIVTEPGTATTSNYYNCEYLAHYDTYTVNSMDYSDVIEIGLTTTFSVELDSSLTAGLDPSIIATINALYESLAEAYSIQQRTFYAKGIGFIYQYSNDEPALGANLLTYTVL